MTPKPIKHCCEIHKNHDDCNGDCLCNDCVEGGKRVW